MNIFKLLAIATFVLLTGCVSTPNFTPETMEGAQCKMQCAENMQQCAGSSYTCDRGYSSCLQACKEIEAVSKK
jgi:starvation-inducible outer membrane lipoprotein